MRFADFKTFGEHSLELALTRAREFAEKLKANPYRNGYTLTLCGPSGVGKSMLTRCIFDELGYDAWRTLANVPQSIYGGRILSRDAQLRDWRKVSDAFKAGEWDLVEAMEAPLLLGLDDVGADYDPNLIAASKLDRVLRSRKGKWTVVNCNLTLPQIAERMDGRIASFLIRDDNTVVEVGARDYALRRMA